MSPSPKRPRLTVEANVQTQRNIQGLDIIYVSESETEDPDVVYVPRSEVQDLDVIYVSTSQRQDQDVVYVPKSEVQDLDVIYVSTSQRQDQDVVYVPKSEVQDPDVIYVSTSQRQDPDVGYVPSCEIQDLNIVYVPKDEEGEEKIKEEAVEQMKKEEEDEEGDREIKGEDEEWHAEEASSPPQGLPISWSLCSLSSSTSNSSSIEYFSWQAYDPRRSLQIPADAESLRSALLQDNVADLVRFMTLKYRLRKLVTQEEMLTVINNSECEFPDIFKRACKCLEVISGVDVIEVDPKIHSYALVNSLDLTYDEMRRSERRMPRNGLLMITLGVIFAEGNSASEEDLWDFLNILGLYPGRVHVLCGEPRKLLVKEWVQENYLECCPVPGTGDPPDYKFLWGPRAHAETSKFKVLEFLVKIKATDPISHYYMYQEALREMGEVAQTRSGPMDLATAMFSAQH